MAEQQKKKSTKAKPRDEAKSRAKERKTEANKKRHKEAIESGVRFNKKSTRAERRAGLTKKPTRA